MLQENKDEFLFKLHGLEVLLTVTENPDVYFIVITFLSHCYSISVTSFLLGQAGRRSRVVGSMF